jgi:mRNA interferase ChpB
MAPGRRIPAKGEIWYVDGDPVTGHEFKGAHYYLVLSQRDLVKALGTAICVPITSGGDKPRSEAVTVYIDGGSTDKGNVTGVALCHQVRALDLSSRRAIYKATAYSHITDEILAKVVDLLDPRL